MKIENIEQEEITYTGNYKIRSIKAIRKQIAHNTYEQYRILVNAYITFLKLENATEKDILTFLKDEDIFITSVERIKG